MPTDFPASFLKIFGLVDVLKNMSPMTVTQKASEIALKLVGGPNLAQIFEVFDRFGNPIFSIATSGGANVFGDRLGVFPPGDIFNAMFQVMGSTGDNLATNAAAFRLGKGTSQSRIIAMGAGAPSSSNPITTGVPPDGSIYFRSDGGTGTAIYQARSGSWTAIL